MKAKWKLIAGAGRLGDTNWGYFPLSVRSQNKQFKALTAHIGETVLITGGGSTNAWLGTLTSVIRTVLGGKPAIRVHLIDIRGWDVGTFEPFIGSWQISIRE